MTVHIMKQMKKWLNIVVVAVTLVSCSPASDFSYPEVYAHRGCWIEGVIPENSLAGIRSAKRFGYPAIEMDVKYTSDGVMVVMHDETINRTMRNADYSEIEEPVYVTRTPFDELRTNYVFTSDDPVLRVQIPTLEEMLNCCRDEGIHPVLHSNIPESFEMAKDIVGDDFTAFSADYDKMAYARSISACHILWDPGRTSAEEACAGLAELGGRCGISTMKYDMLDSAYISTVRNAGYDVQSSIFPSPHDADAIRDGASIMLSDFCWFQTEGRNPVEKVKVKHKALMEGQDYVLSFGDEIEFGAIVIDADVKGKATIIVNGKKEYTVDSESEQKFVVGCRSADIKPSVRIVAGPGGCALKNGYVRFYKI